MVTKIQMPSKLILGQMLQYEVMVSELERLLGKGFIDSDRWRNHPIRQSVFRIKEFDKQGDHLQRDYEITIIAMLVKHLQEIEGNDLPLLKKFKKRIYESVSIDKYFGVRFEINIAASLLRKGVKYLKTEAPDFTIPRGKLTINIECGSSHLSTLRTGDVKYKIASEIRGKAGKKYCTPDTALFIDGTNISFNTPKEILLTSAQLGIRTYLEEVLESTNFGNLTVFSYVHNREDGSFQSNYQRIDNKKISETLKQFLDEFYPVRKFNILNFDVPFHG